MECGDALGTSGGQRRTRETPKAIFASKMGGPGLQMGVQIEAKVLLKNNQKNDDKKIGFRTSQCLQNGGQKESKLR